MPNINYKFKQGQTVYFVHDIPNTIDEVNCCILTVFIETVTIFIYRDRTSIKYKLKDITPERIRRGIEPMIDEKNLFKKKSNALTFVASEINEKIQKINKDKDNPDREEERKNKEKGTPDVK